MAEVNKLVESYLSSSFISSVLKRVLSSKFCSESVRWSPPFLLSTPRRGLVIERTHALRERFCFCPVRRSFLRSSEIRLSYPERRHGAVISCGCSVSFGCCIIL